MIGAEVQKAIFEALMAAPATAGGNVFDRVHDDSAFPRVTIGEEQIVDDGNTCDDGWEVFADVHVWSRQPGFVEAKTIAASVVSRIRAIGSVAGYTVIAVEFEGQQSRRDPDGLTSHIVSSFRFVLTPA